MVLESMYSDKRQHEIPGKIELPKKTRPNEKAAQSYHQG